jgi:Fic family protein
MLIPSYLLPTLPPAAELETRNILRAAAEAHKFLGEVKGRAAAIPNQGILIDSLFLQEAKASSEIENIVTTQDELFQADLFPEGPGSPAAKEVALYRDALRLGYESMRQNQNLITNNLLISIFQRLKGNTGDFRQTPGTALKNDTTGALVYIPPQAGPDIVAHMGMLERFINDETLCDLDPLIKMALIHHQFESIHPFPDGNGRIGRILNILYLVKTGLLDIPILDLSRYITKTKPDYYRLLQSVRDTGEWEPWVFYMLKGVSETAQITLTLIEGIRSLMADYKMRLRVDLPNIYSQDLLNNMFRHPYTRIEYVQQELEISRQTAAKYLDQLSAAGFLAKRQAGRNNYYINTQLVSLFLTVSAAVIYVSIDFPRPIFKAPCNIAISPGSHACPNPTIASPSLASSPLT